MEGSVIQKGIREVFIPENFEDTHEFSIKQIQMCQLILRIDEYTTISNECISILCRFIVFMTKKFNKPSEINKRSARVGLVCQCISKLLKTQVGQLGMTQEVLANAQNAMKTIIEYIGENVKRKSGALIALFEIIEIFGKSIERKYLKKLKELTYKGVVKNNEEIGMLCACLLASIYSNDPKPEAHQSYFSQLLISLQTLLNLSYRIIITKERPGDGMLNIVENEESVMRREQLYEKGEYIRLFKVTCFALQKYLLHPKSFVVNIDISSLFALIQKALVLDYSAKVEDVLDHPFKKETFFASLPFIHLYALELLSSLIVSAKGHLLPYVNNIAIIINQLLRTYDGHSIDQTNIPVYKQINKTIIICSTIFGSCLSVNLFQEIFPILVKPIALFFNNFTNMVKEKKELKNVEFPSQKKKKKKKKVQENTLDSIITTPLIKKTLISVTTIHKVLETCSTFITKGRPEFLDLITQIITTCCSCIDLYHEEVRRGIHLKLTNEITTLIVQKYKLLYSCLLKISAVNTQSPFLAHAISLFRKGVTCKIPNMVMVCSNALNVMEAFLHPKATPLYIPHAESVVHHSIVNAKKLLEVQKEEEEVVEKVEEKFNFEFDFGGEKEKVEQEKKEENRKGERDEEEDEFERIKREEAEEEEKEREEKERREREEKERREREEKKREEEMEETVEEEIKVTKTNKKTKNKKRKNKKRKNISDDEEEEEPKQKKQKIEKTEKKQVPKKEKKQKSKKGEKKDEEEEDPKMTKKSKKKSKQSTKKESKKETKKESKKVSKKETKKEETKIKEEEDEISIEEVIEEESLDINADVDIDMADPDEEQDISKLELHF